MQENIYGPYETHPDAYKSRATRSNASAFNGAQASGSTKSGTGASTVGRSGTTAGGTGAFKGARAESTSSGGSPLLGRGPAFLKAWARSMAARIDAVEKSLIARIHFNRTSTDMEAGGGAGGGGGADPGLKVTITLAVNGQPGTYVSLAKSAPEPL